MDKVFVSLKNKETGEVVDFWPVDAREILEGHPDTYEVVDADAFPGIFEKPVTEKVDKSSVSIPERELPAAEPEAPAAEAAPARNTRRK